MRGTKIHYDWVSRFVEDFFLNLRRERGPKPDDDPSKVVSEKQKGGITADEVRARTLAGRDVIQHYHMPETEGVALPQTPLKPLSVVPDPGYCQVNRFEDLLSALDSKYSVNPSLRRPHQI